MRYESYNMKIVQSEPRERFDTKNGGWIMVIGVKEKSA